VTAFLAPTPAGARAHDLDAAELAAVRADFPVLSRRFDDGRPLVYLDSAATSQKPTCVLAAMDEYYTRHNANVHRGVHTLAEEATGAYEAARDTVAAFIGAPSRREVVFTRNSTESLNLLANTLAWAGPPYGLRPGDEIVVTQMEHHSNLVPWQMVAARTGARLRWVRLTDDGRLDLDDLDEVITPATKVVSFVHISNVLGTRNPVDVLVERAHAVGALAILDASQSVPQIPVDVRDLGVDAMAFTGHKMCGPTGIGVLWARESLLDALPPFLGGGEMVGTVTMESSTYADLPHRFEAGTPPVAEAVGLAAACDYLSRLGMDRVAAHEQAITGYALDALATVPGLRIIGPTEPVDRGGAVSFTVAGVHPHDVGQVLDAEGVAVRVGHHCARPVCDRYGIPATTRASFYVYSTRDEVDALVAALAVVRKVFKV
jgi:cysteine desulfurase/selenocysteine lyase